MARTASEIMMVFRAQNYMSGAIRKIGRDVGGLSRGAQLSNQRTMLQARAAQLRYARSIAEADARSISTGSRGLALQQAKQRLTANEYNNVTRLRMAEEARLVNAKALLDSTTKMEQLSTAVVAGKPVGRGLNRMNLEQIKRAQQAEEINNQRLLSQRVTLNRQAQAAKAALAGQSLAAQQVAAREVELVQREAQLRDAVIARTRAIDQNTLAQARNNFEAEKIAPVETWNARALAIEHAGRVIQMFGLIATASFALAARSAARFQTEATLAATQAITPSPNSVQQIKKTSSVISDEIVKLMATGKAVADSQEFSKGGYDILSGVTQLRGDSINKAKQAIGLLREFNQATKANYGLVTFDQITQAGITILNTFGTKIRNLPHEFDVMQNAVNRGRITMGQFTEGLNQTAAPAKAAGYTFDQMAATLSFLSTKFPSYNRAAVGYARLVEILANPKLIAGLKGAGVSITDTTGKHLLPFEKVIDRLVKKFPQLAKGGIFTQNFLKKFSGQAGYIGARRALTVSVQDREELNKFAKTIPANAKGLVDASARALSDTGEVKWKELVTQFKALVIVVGQGAIPVFATFAKPLEAVLNWFNKLSPSTRRLVGEIGTFAAIGALLGGTFIAIAGGLARIIFQLTLLRRVNVLSKMVEDASKLAGKTEIIAKTGVINPKTGAAFTDIAEAGAAGGLLSRFKGATGSATVGTSGILTTIALLVIFHKQVGELINRLGGLANVVKIVNTALIAWQLTKVAGYMRVLTGALEGAAFEAGVLRTALLGMAGLVVTATVIIVERHKIAKAIADEAHRPGHPLTGGNFNPGNWVWDAIKTVSGTDTPAEASAKVKAMLRARHKAITQAIADSPRISHVIGANQNILNKRFKDEQARLARLRAQGKLDSAANIGPHLTQSQIVDSYIGKVEKAEKLKLLHPNSIPDAKAYESAVAALNKRFKDQPVLLAAINDILSNYSNNIKDATGNTKTLGVTTQDAFNGMKSIFDNFKSQETSVFGTLFGGPFMQKQDKFAFGARITGSDALRDIRSQVTQFKRFHTKLNQLARRGAPAALLNQLLQAGPGEGPHAMEQVNALLSLGKNERVQYFNIFTQAQKMIDNQTLIDLKRQLDIYRKHGRNIALAIVAGLRDENVAVTTAITKMVKQVFPGLPTGATGAGGKPTHHKIPTPVNVNVDVHNHDKKDDSPPITKKAQQRHAHLRTKNRFAIPVGGPR